MDRGHFDGLYISVQDADICSQSYVRKNPIPENVSDVYDAETYANLSPSPLVVKLEYSHPTLSQRIDAIRKLQS